MHKLLKALATNETAEMHGENALFKVNIGKGNNNSLDDDSFGLGPEESFLRRPSIFPSDNGVL